MTREQLVEKVQAAWAALQESCAGLSDDRLEEPVAGSEWSVKDLLAHVTTWEEECLEHLPVLLAGGRTPRYADLYGGLDAFNARRVEEKRALSTAEVRQQMNAVHARLIAYIRSLPEGQFASETRVRRRIRLDTYSHYPIHADMIRRWRETLQA